MATRTMKCYDSLATSILTPITAPKTEDRPTALSPFGALPSAPWFGTQADQPYNPCRGLGCLGPWWHSLATWSCSCWPWSGPRASRWWYQLVAGSIPEHYHHRRVKFALTHHGERYRKDFELRCPSSCCRSGHACPSRSQSWACSWSGLSHPLLMLLVASI